MAIDKLGSAQSLLAALRTDAGQRKERAQGKPNTLTETADASASRKDVSVLRKQMAEIVQSVDVRDADAVRKARPRLVRAVLLWEFGPNLREHPEWQPMLESITSMLEQKGAEGEAEFVALIESLKR